jgi:hypothetical protein
MIAFFGKNIGRVVRKVDIVDYLRLYGCTSTDPQPRHFGMQIGLNFLVQGCKHPRTGRKLRPGEYCLLDVRQTHPNHHTNHRISKGSQIDFETIKSMYDHRCACCGSPEGGPHFKNKHLLTRLDRGHCDPRRPLDATNCIPMCTTCNMVYRDRAVINRRGFVSSWLGVDVDCDPELEKEDELTADDVTSFVTCDEGDANTVTHRCPLPNPIAPPKPTWLIWSCVSRIARVARLVMSLWK